MSLFNIKLSFIGQWKIRIYKRSHVETGNTPHNPAENRMNPRYEESPVRRSLRFQQSLSPVQKVIVIIVAILLVH